MLWGYLRPPPPFSASQRAHATSDHLGSHAHTHRHPTQKLQTSKEDLDFRIALIAVALFRYLTDHITSCSLSITTKILTTHDMICLSVHLLERAPWLKRSATGGLQRFDDNRWVPITRADLPQLGKLEAQVWLILYNLLLEPECRQKYEYNTYNQAIILRLREFILPETMDQLPVLGDLLRYLEELSLMTLRTDASVVRAGGFIEELSEHAGRAEHASMTDADFQALAQAQVATVFNDSEESRRETAKGWAGAEGVLVLLVALLLLLLRSSRPFSTLAYPPSPSNPS